MSQGIIFKKATKTMTVPSMQHLWKYESIHSMLSLLLNWSCGTPLLQNNKTLHRNNHMSWVSLEKTPPAAQILFSVSFRQKPRNCINKNVSVMFNAKGAVKTFYNIKLSVDQTLIFGECTYFETVLS